MLPDVMLSMCLLLADAEIIDKQVAPPAAAASDRTSDSTESAPLSPHMAALRRKIRMALAYYYTRPVNSRDHCPWEVMHWLIAYGVDAEILAEGPGGKAQNAVGWLCYNHPCRDLRMLALRNDRLTGLEGVGLQGHSGQFLAILAQSRVKIDYPIRVGDKSLTVADLVESEKLTCTRGSELTFKLIALMHYLDSDATWTNAQGESWDIPALIREELQKPIHGAACGGTHRLMGLSYAVRTRQKRGQPLDGEYLRAKAFMESYQKYTLGLQNKDGSFSTAWFVSREARSDVGRRVQTSGHILEWLVYSLTDEELDDPRIFKAANYLAEVLLAGRKRDWKIGPLGHALRSLTLYDRRVFCKPALVAPLAIARRPADLPVAPASPLKPIDQAPATNGEKPAKTATPDVGHAAPVEVATPSGSKSAGNHSAPSKSAGAGQAKNLASPNEMKKAGESKQAPKKAAAPKNDAGIQTAKSSEAAAAGAAKPAGDVPSPDGTRSSDRSQSTEHRKAPDPGKPIVHRSSRRERGATPPSTQHGEPESGP